MDPNLHWSSQFRNSVVNSALNGTNSSNENKASVEGTATIEDNLAAPSRNNDGMSVIPHSANGNSNKNRATTHAKKTTIVFNSTNRSTNLQPSATTSTVISPPHHPNPTTGSPSHSPQTVRNTSITVGGTLNYNHQTATLSIGGTIAYNHNRINVAPLPGGHLVPSSNSTNLTNITPETSALAIDGHNPYAHPSGSSSPKSAVPSAPPNGTISPRYLNKQKQQRRALPPTSDIVSTSQPSSAPIDSSSVDQVPSLQTLGTLIHLQPKPKPSKERKSNALSNTTISNVVNPNNPSRGKLVPRNQPITAQNNLSSAPLNPNGYPPTQPSSPLESSLVLGLNATSLGGNALAEKPSPATSKRIASDFHSKSDLKLEQGKNVFSLFDSDKLLLRGIDELQKQKDQRVLDTMNFKKAKRKLDVGLDRDELNFLFNHYAQKAPTLNKKSIRSLAADALEYLPSLYKEVLVKENPNVDKGDLEKFVSSEAAHLAPGSLDEVATFLMTTLDINKDGVITRTEFSLQWNSAAQTLFANLKENNALVNRSGKCVIL